MDAIELAIFSSRIAAVCDEMGAVLKRAAFSPNIKDRLDFSCAIFDPAGQLCAQAAHIPVHLGSMAWAMADIVTATDWRDGDMIVLNDPYLGGTHLPDITLIAPLFVAGQLVAFVANRAHHADIGAGEPGSMPISSSLEQEGRIIPPTRLVADNRLLEPVLSGILGERHNPLEGQGDFSAQISANRTGLTRLRILVEGLGSDAFATALAALNDYAATLARQALKAIPDGDYTSCDIMDDDGMGNRNIPICAHIKVDNGTIEVDFRGTAKQVKGNINCPLSVAAAAVYYVFRCLMPPQTPACAGSFRSLSLSAPVGSLLNAQRPAAVAAGNVETSTRIVDVLCGALANALPQHIPAASQGSMNNLAMGAHASVTNTTDDAGSDWDYYETIGGGMGGNSQHRGPDALQTHMTNTLNTPIEALEMRFPLRISRYEIRRGSGGAGQHRGGDGLIREFEFLSKARASLITERRAHAPWGLQGGQPGQPGRNLLDGEPLPAKTSIEVEPGQRLRIETPGGGGWGSPT